jgi:hypothetical protein
MFAVELKSWNIRLQENVCESVPRNIMYTYQLESRESTEPPFSSRRCVVVLCTGPRTVSLLDTMLGTCIRGALCCSPIAERVVAANSPLRRYMKKLRNRQLVRIRPSEANVGKHKGSKPA